MKVVVLDTATLPVPLTRLAWTTGWKQYPANSLDKIVDAAGKAAIAIEEVLKQADVLTLHCPLGEATRGRWQRSL